jgi:hypothetical protein
MSRDSPHRPDGGPFVHELMKTLDNVMNLGLLSISLETNGHRRQLHMSTTREEIPRPEHIWHDEFVAGEPFHWESGFRSSCSPSCTLSVILPSDGRSEESALFFGLHISKSVLGNSTDTAIKTQARLTSLVPVECVKPMRSSRTGRYQPNLLHQPTVLL